MTVNNVHGHGSFDNSTRLILRNDALELEVILGQEAAAKFLKDSPAGTLRLGTLSANGKMLAAQWQAWRPTILVRVGHLLHQRHQRE